MNVSLLHNNSQFTEDITAESLPLSHFKGQKCSWGKIRLLKNDKCTQAGIHSNAEQNNRI